MTHLSECRIFNTLSVSERVLHLLRRSLPCLSTGYQISRKNARADQKGQPDSKTESKTKFEGLAWRAVHGFINLETPVVKNGLLRSAECSTVRKGA